MLLPMQIGETRSPSPHERMIPMSPSATAQEGGFKLRNIQLSTKLYGSFFLLSLLALIIGLFGIWSVNQVQGQAANIVNQSIPKLSAVSDLRRMRLKIETDIYSALGYAFTDESQVQSYLDDAASLEQQRESMIAHYQSLALNADEQQMLSAYQQAAQPWVATLSQSENLLAQKTNAANLQVLALVQRQWVPQGKTMSTTLEQLNTYTVNESA